MLSHDNYTWLGNSLKYMEFKQTPRIVSFLPLSHVAGQVIDIMTPLITGACVYFTDDKALKGTLPNYLKEVKPTFFMSVPRVYEKLEEGIRKAFESKPKILNWATRVLKYG